MCQHLYTDLHFIKLSYSVADLNQLTRIFLPPVFKDMEPLA